VTVLEDHARLLLVLHAVLGAATVAVTTHLFLWCRHWARNGVSRRRGVRWFAAVGLGIYAAQFVLGNLVYPAYKIRVRAAYLDNPAAIAAETAARAAANAEVHARAGLPPPAATEAPRTLAHVARLFDIKEHWAAVGLPLAIVAALLVFLWDPRAGGTSTTRWLLLGASGGAAACAWLAAVVGLWVSAVRAVG
jgi:hypothetical protein